MKINQCNNRVSTPFGDFQIDVDNLFDQVFGDRGDRSKTPRPETDWTPRVSISESETAYEFVMELPGVNPSSVSIEMKDNQLEVSGEKVLSELSDGFKSLREERYRGSFRRQFEFAQQVNSDAIAAEFKNGLLTIGLPKAESVLPRKIEIKVAE
jgi:HSP20 family protein